MNKPLVSVIIPTYKRSKFIKRAIDSVLAQTYDNIEIIVVDDNIPDSLEKIATRNEIIKYNEEEKIKYIDLQNNSGGAIARNRGIELAKGKYLCFLDDDDEYLSNKISRQVEIFEKSQLHLSVVGGFAEVRNKSNQLIRIEKKTISGDVYEHQLANNICTTSIAMIRHEVIKKSGGFEKMPSSQEHMFFLKVLKVNPYYDYVDDVVVKIHHHDGERISTNYDKPKGAIKLFDFVKSETDSLTYKEKKRIAHHHLINISLSFLSIGNKREALRYFVKLVFNDRSISVDSIKLFINIAFGLEFMNSLKAIISFLK